MNRFVLQGVRDRREEPGRKEIIGGSRAWRHALKSMAWERGLALNRKGIH